MMVSNNNVSPRQRPDIPARFESLNDDTLTTTLQFVGDKSYKSFGGINKQCREVYLNTPGMAKETYLYGYAPLSVITDKIERGGRFNENLYERVGRGVVCYNRLDVFEWILEEQKELVLCGICGVAAEEGRLDLLEEVWNNVDDEENKRFMFGGVDSHAAGGGKLNVIKWLETKGFASSKIMCSFAAAHYGQLHILKWLKEERGFELDGGLYDEAIFGGQLHVMKWLREQEVDWDEFTFATAAEEGNMNILQWLHDEGCSWPEDLIVSERRLKPEVIEWLQSNGYGNRIDS